MMKTEANNKKLRGAVRLDVTLQPVPDGLTDQQILELYRSGRRLYVEKEVREEVSEEMRLAIRCTLRCKWFIAPGKTREDIYTYYKKVFGGAEGAEAVERMRNARQMKQFISEHVGRLTRLGVLYGQTEEMARALSWMKISLETTKRYIRRGKERVGN